jgi:hypothetical protein
VIDGDRLLPARTVLLHIGPHKTGTTAIQSSLRQSAAEMAEHNVVLAGRSRLHMRLAAYAAVGHGGLRGDQPSRTSHWQEVTKQVRDEPDARVIVSSEFFSDATGDAPSRIIQDLGKERVHLVVTLRPLAKVLPSSWQQYVRNRMSRPYEEWLTGTLAGKPFQSPTPSFWRRHRHDALIERWSALVGTENTTVIVMDEADRGMPLRVFEQLTGLPDHLLGNAPPATNRSLTWAEAELIRELNIVATRDEWPDRMYHLAVRQGAVRTLLLHPVQPGEQPITTPDWALERAAEIGAAAADKIATLGVTVIGDLNGLGAGAPALPAAGSGNAETPTEIPLDRARDALAGALAGAGALNAASRGLEETRWTDLASSRELIGVLSQRLRRRAGGRRRSAPSPASDSAAMDDSQRDDLED